MKTITVETFVQASIQKVWECWTEPEHISGWAFASDDWEASYAENDVRDGGRFLTRMAAKDGSASFDLTGSYTRVVPFLRIDSVLDDGRTVSVTFTETDGGAIHIAEEFEMENENSEELQRNGWQAILHNFKKYVEAM